jgi:GNAT superfamily N-acetyltransferase
MKALEASAFLPFVPGGLLGRAMRRVDDLPEAGGLLRTPDAPTGEVVDQMARFRAKWDSRGVDNWVSEGDNHIVLSQVVVPEGQRGQGVGSDFMEELTAYADEVGKPLLLTPSADFGGSVPRLREFYSRYGFKPNKGSMRDHSLPNESMRRNPNSLRSDDLPEAGGLLRTPDAPTGASKIIPRKR